MERAREATHMGSSLDYDAIRRLVPDLDELKALFDAVLAASRPNRDHRWTGTGELGTVGTREVDAADLSELTRRAVEGQTARLQQVYSAVSDALEAIMEGDLARAGDALLTAAAVEERSGRPSEAAAFAEAALALARTRGDPRAVSLALRRQARAERSVGRLDAALTHYSDAASVADSGADRAGRAEAAIGAGNVLEQQGRWSEAQTWYASALEALRDVEPATPAHWHARLNMHIALLRSQGDGPDTEDWLRDAESVAEALGDPSRHVFVGNARGQLLMARGRFDEAEAPLLAALQNARRGRASATIRLNLAECHLARGRTLDANEQAREAERDALTGAASDKLPEVYRMLGRAVASTGNPDAFVLFERSLELTGDDPALLLERAQTLQAYGDAEQTLGQQSTAQELWAKAMDTYQRLGIEGFRRPWSDCFDAPFPSFDATEASS